MSNRGVHALFSYVRWKNVVANLGRGPQANKELPLSNLTRKEERQAAVERERERRADDE